MNQEIAIDRTNSTKFIGQPLPASSAVANNKHSMKVKADALTAIESMRSNSNKIVSYGASLGGAVGQACMDAVKAIWEMMLSILRFLARLFGAKLKEKTADSEVASSDSVASKKPALTNVDEFAQQAKEIVTSAATGPQLHAFLRSLEFAGLSDADLALVEFARSPSNMRGSQSCEAVLSNCLQRIAGSMDKLDEMAMQANMERASAADYFSSRYEPPILAEALVSMQRLALAKGLVPEVDLEAAQRLVKADEQVSLVEAHRQVIVGNTMLVTAQALVADASIEPYVAALQRIAGGVWGQKLEEARDMFRVAANIPASELLAVHANELDVAASTAAMSSSGADIAALDRVDADLSTNSVSAEAAKRAVKEFLSGIPGVDKGEDLPAVDDPSSPDATGAPVSAAERLRRASHRANQVLPPIDTGSFGESPDDSPVPTN